MDKMLFIAASGAKQDMLATSLRANNIANAQTTGFRAQLEQARSMPAFGEGLPTRVFSMTENPANNYESGPLITTGRDLDVAIQGNGWFAVQNAKGQEAYSRDGGFQLSADGALTDTSGNLVMGNNGPIFLPVPIAEITIAPDGTISTIQQGAPENAVQEVGQLKLVNPDYAAMRRDEDGLFSLKQGGQADFDENVRVASGMLEGSNVNVVNEMVSMISLQRHYEMQVKMMKTAERIDQQGNMMLRII